jgi:hypothetical protein
VAQLDSDVHFDLQYGMGQLKHLIAKLQTGEVQVTVHGAAAPPTDLTPLLDLLKQLSGTALGPPPDGGEGAVATLGQSTSGAEWQRALDELQAAAAGGSPLTDAVHRVIEWTQVKGAEFDDMWMTAVLDLAGKVKQKAADVSTAAFSLVPTDVLAAIQAMMPPDVARPETALATVGKTYTYAWALGWAASAASALAHAVPYPLGAPTFGGLARMIGELAGFKPLADSIAHAYYGNYVRKPLDYLVQAAARPHIPGAAELSHLLSRRHMTAAGTLLDGSRVPHGYDRALGYLGYEDGWIGAFRSAMWAEMGIRYLRQVAAASEQTDDWWFLHLRRLGYREEDIPQIKAAAEAAACASERNKCLSALYDLRAGGFISAGEYRDRLTAYGVRGRKLDYLADAAELDAQQHRLTATVSVLELQYDRNQITDEDFAAGLDGVYADSRISNLTFSLGKLRRYHKVWLLTPSEEIREALPTYKNAAILGLVSLDEYYAKLCLSGMEPAIAQLQRDLVSAARDRAQLAEFKSYGLPDLRDRVVHGLLSPSDYSDALMNAGFPQEYVPCEVELATAMLARRVQGEVRAQLVPAYTEAYKAQLISAGTLTAVMQEAGFDARAISQRIDDLDYTREQAAARKASQLAAQQERLRKAEERAAAQERTKRQREAEAALRAEAKGIAAREKQAAATAHTIAKAVHALLRNKDATAVAQVQGLITRLNQVYNIAVGLLPDDLYQITLELSDELGRPGGPDLAVLEDVVGTLDDRLAALSA